MIENYEIYLIGQSAWEAGVACYPTESGLRGQYGQSHVAGNILSVPVLNVSYAKSWTGGFDPQRPHGSQQIGGPLTGLPDIRAAAPLAAKLGQEELLFFDTSSGQVEFASQLLEAFGFDVLPRCRLPAENPLDTPELAREYPLALNSGARSASAYP